MIAYDFYDRILIVKVKEIVDVTSRCVQGGRRSAALIGTGEIVGNFTGVSFLRVKIFCFADLRGTGKPDGIGRFRLGSGSRDMAER
ncbi:hypothetical protein [[Clostridium] aminophilum]|uniref:hypothetical protein n=1 Tax=[Clostridium] aminophilum TaxID=1526 RepID=UPI001160A629|nr:hypothetical protein [[Clostridium] aminophilum]